MDIHPREISRRCGDWLATGTSRHALSTEEWEHPHHGTARPVGLALDPTDKRIGDAIALMTPGCVLGGWASRYLQGNAYADGFDRYGEELDVQILTGPHAQLRKRTGVRPSERRVHRNEVEVFQGIPVTTIARSAYDDMLNARSLMEAVVLAEMAISHVTPGARTTARSLQHLTDAHKKTRGIVRVRQAVARACERSGSPWESRTRVFVEDEVGIDGWLVNHPIFGPAGELLGIADLFKPEIGLVIESDGAGHREEEQHSKDNVREEKFEHAGMEVCRVSAIDHRDRAALQQRLRASEASAIRNVRAKLWTLDQPDWWHSWEPGRRYRLR